MNQATKNHICLTPSNSLQETEEPVHLPPEMRLLTYAQAAEILQVCQKTVENICRVRKEIPLVYIGYKPRIIYSELVAYIARGGSGSARTKS